jgi:hypothetical protein
MRCRLLPQHASNHLSTASAMLLCCQTFIGCPALSSVSSRANRRGEGRVLNPFNAECSGSGTLAATAREPFARYTVPFRPCSNSTRPAPAMRIVS